jgi:hypothetical protein
MRFATALNLSSKTRSGQGPRGWSAPTIDARLKKRIARTVIHEVFADIDTDAAEIVSAHPGLAGSIPRYACPGAISRPACDERGG